MANLHKSLFIVVKRGVWRAAGGMHSKCKCVDFYIFAEVSEWKSFEICPVFNLDSHDKNVFNKWLAFTAHPVYRYKRGVICDAKDFSVCMFRIGLARATHCSRTLSQ